MKSPSELSENEFNRVECNMHYHQHFIDYFSNTSLVEITYTLRDYTNPQDIGSDSKRCEVFTLFNDWCDPIFYLTVNRIEPNGTLTNTLTITSREFVDQKFINLVMKDAQVEESIPNELDIALRIVDNDNNGVNPIASFRQRMKVGKKGATEVRLGSRIGVTLVVEVACAAGYSGTDCETNCLSRRCDPEGEGRCTKHCNNGQCQLDSGNMLCVCDQGWTGQQCDQLENDVAIIKGITVAPNTDLDPVDATTIHNPIDPDQQSISTSDSDQINQADQFVIVDLTEQDIPWTLILSVTIATSLILVCFAGLLLFLFCRHRRRWKKNRSIEKIMATNVMNSIRMNSISPSTTPSLFDSNSLTYATSDKNIYSNGLFEALPNQLGPTYGLGSDRFRLNSGSVRMSDHHASAQDVGSSRRPLLPDALLSTDRWQSDENTNADNPVSPVTTPNPYDHIGKELLLGD